jgi:hypothetical protein
MRGGNLQRIRQTLAAWRLPDGSGRSIVKLLTGHVKVETRDATQPHTCPYCGQTVGGRDEI